jgi:paraquat-inducible protein B
MTEELTDPYQAQKRPQTRVSPIWFVPIVAVLIGIWLVYDNIVSRGPLITLYLSDAEGIDAGSTSIRLLNVEVGRVEQVSLSEDLTRTVVSARMVPDAERMLARDTLFWVVKPRIGREGISGLSTVLSGAYIQLQPGQSNDNAREFQVLEQPPISSSGTAGKHIQLMSAVGNSLRVGDPVSYQGLIVGRVAEAEFRVNDRLMYHRLFVESPYDVMITENTRFWPSSGVDLRLDSEGIRVSVESIEALLVGGITFGYLDEVAGSEVPDNASFFLYPDQDTARQDSYYEFLEFVLLFEDGIRGLTRGAPVEYRGVRVGTVVNAPWNFNMPSVDQEQQYGIPVLIRIEPQRIARPGELQTLSDQEWRTRFEQLFALGLRASLKTGSLLTGAMYVDLDFQASPMPMFITSTYEERPVFPTSASGLAQIEAQVTNLLAKLNALEIEPVLARLEANLVNSEAILGDVKEIASSVQSLLESPELLALPDNLSNTLADLRETMQGFAPDSPAYQELTQTMNSMERLMRDLQPVARTLGDQPNALIFERRAVEDPQPRAAGR